MLQTGFGGPEVVCLQDVREPRPEADEVVVRVEACALNALDVLQRRGPGVIPGFSLPHIAGLDVAGTVVALGTAVSAVTVGDRVVVNPTHGCGTCDFCLAGSHGYCPQVHIIGGNVPGGFAELVAVPAAAVLQVPPEVSPAEAATLPTVWATAWHAMHSVGRVAPGECVIVQAGASAVSLAAIQLAKRAGATVVAVASTDAKLAAAGAAGAKLCLRNDSAVVEAVHDFTQGRGADMVLDHVGEATWESSLASLAIGGRVVMLGNTSGDEVRMSLSNVFHRGLHLLGAGSYTAADFVAAVTTCFAEGLRLPIAREFALDDLPAAWSVQESRDVVGKVIVRP